MKCPSCGIWNRAHFTKCFRCGAPLTGEKNASEKKPDAEEEEVSSSVDESTAAETPVFSPEDAPEVLAEAVEESLDDAQHPEEPHSGEEADPLSDSEIFSLYDQGDWSDDEEDDSEEIYAGASAPPQAPFIRPVETLDGDDEPPTVYRPAAPEKKSPPLPSVPEDDDDEPVTVYRAPEKPAEEAPAQETRRFAPVSPDAVDGSTRKFAPIGTAAAADAPVPPLNDTEPEVTPTDPSISHEIIHAIFTNPPAHLEPGHDIMDDPRPRKLMSRKRLPPQPEIEEEPETVYKPREQKAEPRVDNVEEFKPTARLAAQKADEKGDEFTAFATAKRNLVAEVEPNDPFEEAIGIPHSEKAAEATKEEAPEKAETPAEAPAQPEPVKPAEPEQPAWVKEALLNLGQEQQMNNLSSSRTSGNRSRRLPQPNLEYEPGTAQQRPSRRVQAEEIRREPEEGFAPRSERRERPSRRPAAPMQQPQEEPEAPAYSAPRSGLEAIARYESNRSNSVLSRRRTAPAAETAPQSEPIPAQEQRMEETVRPARREARPFRPVSRAPQREEIVEETERLPREERPEAPMRLHSSRTAEPDSSARSSAKELRIGGLRVQNPIRAAIVALIALALVGLLIWGIVAGISAIAKGVSKPNPSESPAPSETQPAEADPNAPVVTTGEVNGRPGHIITFKGNDNDIIYISDENLSGSYNIAIVDGIGTLQIEDSALIGDRYVDSDVEVTLNPVLHESGSGKETKMSPITFTVTPPDAYLEIVSPAGGADETTLSIYQVKIRVETGSSVTIDGNDVSDMITEEDNGMGSIVTNVNVEAKGENQIPITVMKKGCKSVTQNIVLTRPEMTIPIELDAATPSTVQSDTVTISGTVEAGVKVSVTSPISGEVTNNSDGSFSFVAKLSFGENDIVIVATKGEETSTLTHTVTYEPTYGEYVNKAYKMDYANLATYAGKYQPFLCSGQVVEVFQTEPYTCTFNVGTAEDPKYIYLQMVPGKPLEEGKTYKVYADVDASGTKDGYPYMIGRFFLEVAQ